MSETRQVLEEAAAKLWGEECREVVIRDHVLFERMCRFDTLLEAEAWTDAALMLVPEGKGFCIMGNAAKVGRHVGVGETPALAIVQAALRAKEAGDV